MLLSREIWFTAPQAAQITLGSGPGLLQGGLSALAGQTGPAAELCITSQKIICCCLVGACCISSGSLIQKSCQAFQNCDQRQANLWQKHGRLRLSTELKLCLCFPMPWDYFLPLLYFDYCCKEPGKWWASSISFHSYRWKCFSNMLCKYSYLRLGRAKPGRYGFRNKSE